MPAYYGAVNTSCALDRCVLKVREMIDWEHKYPARDMGNGKIRAWVWVWPCRAPVFPAWTWAVLPSS